MSSNTEEQLQNEDGAVFPTTGIGPGAASSPPPSLPVPATVEYLHADAAATAEGLEVAAAAADFPEPGAAHFPAAAPPVGPAASKQKPAKAPKPMSNKAELALLKRTETA